MKTFVFQSVIDLPRPREEVFPFFADAANLQRITPAWLDFRMASPLPLDMRAGALIDYRLRVRGLPLRWRTHIQRWEPPVRFVDEQLRGPYRLWVHEHTFEEIPEGTRCRDQVHYAVWGGWLVNELFVRRDVERIFAYRSERLREIFSAGASALR